MNEITEMTSPMKLTAAIKTYFGYKSAGALAGEYKQLTEDDKRDFVEMFAAIGVVIDR